MIPIFLKWSSKGTEYGPAFAIRVILFKRRIRHIYKHAIFYIMFQTDTHKQRNTAW